MSHLAAIEEDLKERKRIFQSLMAAAPREFIEWAADWFHTQAKTFGYNVPWDVNYVKKEESDAPSPKVKVKTNGITNPADPLDKGYNWIGVLQAPVVKKKASNAKALHLLKGMKVKYYKSSWDTEMSIGTVEGFTKLYVKITKEGNSIPNKIPYGKVHFVHVPYKK